MKNNAFRFVELALYYIVIFFLLREWLVPIMELTRTGYMELILLFIVISLAISLFRINFIVSLIIKILYITWFITFVYTGKFVLSTEGIRFLFNDFQTNIGILLQADWVNVTDPFLTFLFFILIWMLIYLIQYWVTVKMSIFYFLVLTVFFVGTLDTFTEYDGSTSIVKIILLGLIMTSLLFIKRLLSQSNIEVVWSKYVKLVLPVILLVGTTSVVAAVLPKADPQWPDPIPFIKTAAGKGGVQGEGKGNGVSKVGYGENDSRLGGSFVADDTVVFLAETETKQYWRVETKDVYTSKGWERSDYFSGTTLVFRPEETIPHSLPVGPAENTKTATVQVMYPYDFVIQPYGMKSVSVENPAIEFRMDGNTDKIVPYENDESLQLSNYFVQYSKPVYLYSQLKNPTEQIDPSITERYLQLPETLPTRVRELAVDVVKGRETPYDQARAIEMYFRQNGFRYDTDEVAIPSEDQDYVDQFLFETKIGYCDNFSSAMVVMLRSIGIPARWVKGFAGGDTIDSNGSMRTFEITNNDAHSWVEAYIPNVGWVNFEPTIGFNSTRSIDFDIETGAEKEEVLTIDEKTEPDEVVKEKEKQHQTTSKENKFFKNTKNIFKENKFVSIVILLLILLGVFALYKWRGKWLPKVYIKLHRQKKFDEASFESFYLQLLKLLEMKGFKRKEGQTLQAYAKEIDAYFETNRMSAITKEYERFIYAKNSVNIDFDKMKESWEYLINRITS